MQNGQRHGRDNKLSRVAFLKRAEAAIFSGKSEDERQHP